MIELRHYQQEMIAKARALISSGVRRILIQSPTGSGKTILAAFMLYEAWKRGKTVWFIVHRRELVKQSVKQFWDAGIPAGIVASGFCPDPKAGVQVASIQTLIRRHDQLQSPDLVTWDECQHLGARTWSELHKAYPNAIHIGLSATPCRTDGTGLGAYFDRMILGPSTASLIGDGWLSPYRLFGPKHPDLSGIHTVAGDYNRHELADVMKSSTVVGDAVSEYQALGEGLTGIAFTWSVESSIELAQRFNDVGVPAAHIDGTTNDTERDAAVEAFRNGRIKILSNVDIVGEGFDLPACHIGYFLRPTKSLIVYLQQIGRVLRPAPGKVARLYDHAGNHERFGFPDDEREWSLDGIERRKKKKEASDATKVCPGCFCVVPRMTPKCPECAHEFLIVPRSVEELEGELHELNVDDMRRQRAIAQGQAKDLASLIALGKARKMRNPFFWAKKVMESREKKEQERQQRKQEKEAAGWLSF